MEHIGIAVNSVKLAGEIYSKLLNTPVYKTETVESEHVLTAFLQSGPNKIELLEALNDDSAVAKFIAKKGEGIHHIAFDVDDIDATFNALKQASFIVLEDAPVFLSFWKNGCKYFNILGPDGERLEFNQIL